MDITAHVRPALLANRSEAVCQQVVGVFTDAWETGVLTPERIRTGSIYEAVPADTYRVVAMRFWPRDRRRNVDHVWRPDLAPSMHLLGLYQRRQLTWAQFAARYLAQLDRAPAEVLLQLIDWLGEIPARYPTVTFLCCEHAPGGDERLVHCHRRLLRAWLLGEAVSDVAPPVHLMGEGKALPW